MAYTLFAAVLEQDAVPLFALIVWPAKASWGEAGVNGVLAINLMFVARFLVCGCLFRRASRQVSQ